MKMRLGSDGRHSCRTFPCIKDVFFSFSPQLTEAQGVTPGGTSSFAFNFFQTSLARGLRAARA